MSVIIFSFNFSLLQTIFLLRSPSKRTKPPHQHLANPSGFPDENAWPHPRETIDPPKTVNRET